MSTVGDTFLLLQKDATDLRGDGLVCREARVRSESERDGERTNQHTQRPAGRRDAGHSAPTLLGRQQSGPEAFPERRLYGRVWPASMEGSWNGLALQRSLLGTPRHRPCLPRWTFCG